MDQNRQSEIKASADFVNMMTDFMINEIGSKALDGITYTFVFQKENEKERFNRYMNMRKEATRCGYTQDEAFRIYELCNGYIFDMDLSYAKIISYKLAKAVHESNGGQTPVEDFIADNPEKRRKADMKRLSDYIINRWRDGSNIVEVALFSRNSSPKISITGVNPETKETMRVEFRAFSIRHWDIETVNLHYLIPAGIRIARLDPCEILPSKTGVRFRMYIEQVPEEIRRRAYSDIQSQINKATSYR